MMQPVGVGRPVRCLSEAAFSDCLLSPKLAKTGMLTRAIRRPSPFPASPRIGGTMLSRRAAPKLLCAGASYSLTAPDGVVVAYGVVHPPVDSLKRNF
jgi:hypothetical protein